MARRSAFSYSPELRERAVRLLLDHAIDHPSRWMTILAVGERLGGRADALWRWFRQSARDAGLGADSPVDERR